jgi:acyl carrier protein
VMNDDEIRRAVLDALARVAPEADLDALEPDVDLREQIDVDSMDLLNMVIGIHERTGVDVPERDYPKLVTLDGCVAYLRARLDG